jgi:hypothetical protein
MLVTLCMPIIDLLVVKAFYINWLSNQFNPEKLATLEIQAKSNKTKTQHNMC